jgi:hypothetical protein
VRDSDREADLVAPDQPGLPARVSELMFPARGTVARLLEPREASAVLGSVAILERIVALRPVLCFRLRWFAILGTSWLGILRLVSRRVQWRRDRIFRGRAARCCRTATMQRE